MISNYKDRCGSCARYVYCVMDGEIRKIGKCHTPKKGERICLASQPMCDEYLKNGGRIRIETEEGAE